MNLLQMTCVIKNNVTSKTGKENLLVAIFSDFIIFFFYSEDKFQFQLLFITVDK